MTGVGVGAVLFFADADTNTTALHRAIADLNETISVLNAELESLRSENDSAQRASASLTARIADLQQQVEASGLTAYFAGQHSTSGRYVGTLVGCAPPFLFCVRCSFSLVMSHGRHCCC